jgi:hypothetical protein
MVFTEVPFRVAIEEPARLSEHRDDAMVAAEMT